MCRYIHRPNSEEETHSFLTFFTTESCLSHQVPHATHRATISPIHILSCVSYVPVSCAIASQLRVLTRLIIYYLLRSQSTEDFVLFLCRATCIRAFCRHVTAFRKFLDKKQPGWTYFVVHQENLLSINTNSSAL